MMKALGAQIVIVPSDNKRITEALIKRMIDKADDLSREPGHWWCDQLINHDAVRGYLPQGEEIWWQSGGRAPLSIPSAPPTPSTARRKRCGDTEAVFMSWLWNRRNRPCFGASRQERTG